MALEDKDIKQINEMIGAGVTAAMKPLTESLTAVAGTVKGLTEGDNSVAALVTKNVTEAMAKLAPKPEDKGGGGAGGDKGKDQDAGNMASLIAEAIKKELGPIAAKVTKIEEGNTAAEKAAAKKALIAGVISKKFPGAKSPAHRVQIEELEEYLDLNNPADEKSAEAVVEKWSKRKGKDVLDRLAKPFTANPAAEGAMDPAPNADKVKEQIERIDKAPVGARI